MHTLGELNYVFKNRWDVLHHYWQIILHFHYHQYFTWVNTVNPLVLSYVSIPIPAPHRPRPISSRYHFSRHPSICHAGLGTGIRCSDCYTAAHGVLTPIFHRLNPTEAATSRVFTSTSTDFLHTIPRGATYGTCAISIEFPSLSWGCIQLIRLGIGHHLLWAIYFKHVFRRMVMVVTSWRMAWPSRWRRLMLEALKKFAPLPMKSMLVT